MRCLVLTDVHSNIEALDAVLADAPEVDRVLLLGDVVGYGPRPNEVIERLRGLDDLVAVRGNHDRGVCQPSEDDQFNEAARRALQWTRTELTSENMEWLKGLPLGPRQLDAGVVLSHGSPLDEDAYIFGVRDAEVSLSACQGRIVLFGHTHLPTVFSSVGPTVQGRLVGSAEVVSLGTGVERWLVNPGSVGQPRDGNPEAAYGVLDVDRGRFEFRRAAYDVTATQEAMESAGLPEALSQRLSVGH